MAICGRIETTTNPISGNTLQRGFSRNVDNRCVSGWLVALLLVVFSLAIIPAANAAEYITASIDHTKIDADLTDFPVLIHLSAESGANGFNGSIMLDALMPGGSDAYKKRFAVYAPDGTQCYTEIEKLDSTNHEAWLWVKVPQVSADADTQLRIYYDPNGEDNQAYVGETSEQLNFQLVLENNVEGTYDKNYAYSPCVINDGGLYKMWYSGYDGSVWRLMYATSTDGISWSVPQLIMDRGAEGTYDTEGLYAPFVIKEGGVYKMWYNGRDGTHIRLIYATSLDGITWTNHQLAGRRRCPRCL